MKTQSEIAKYSETLAKTIRSGLQALDTDVDWLANYDKWSSLDANQFLSLMEITNPFNISCAGNNYIFVEDNFSHITDLEIIKMSVFLSEKLQTLTRTTFENVRTERNPYKKITCISKYFKLIDKIVNSQELSGCIVTLYNIAEKQMVLQGKRTVDLYASFYSLEENLRKRSTNSIYLLFTYWRLKKDNKSLNTLISAIIDYIQTYFYDYNNDLDMHLYFPLDKLSPTKKLQVILHWLKLIAFHTNGIFEKYKELDWLCPVDRMVDEIISTNRISRFEMLEYKRIFADDDEKTVQKKAIGNHGYAIWIKTVDIMYIVTDIFHVLYNLPEDKQKSIGATKAIIIDQLDNMTKIKEYYTRTVFFHQVYYQLKRHYIESTIMEALESDAKQLSASVDDFILYLNAIASDDIETMTQAKQKYIANLAGFSNKEQEEKLDKITTQISRKIKESISKTEIYDELYSAVCDNFKAYSGTLMKYPQIFSSLVSAEYLYKQYVEQNSPIDHFDYSCISIMYYMALEDFANRLVYIPYEKDILANIDECNTKRKSWQYNDSKIYISNFSSYWAKKESAWKKSCEIGVLGHLFKDVEKETEFQAYLFSHFPNIDINSFSKFGYKLVKIAPRRNDAAHGGNYLTYSDVCVDKENVYAAVSNYRGLILELLEILFPLQ